MVAAQALRAHPIGALEIKSYYRKSMTLALLVAVSVHLAMMAAWLGYQAWFVSQEATAPRIVVIDAEMTPIPTRTMTYSVPEVQVPVEEVVIPKVGIPVPVPDAEVVDDVPFATRADLADLNNPVSLGAAWGSADSFVVDVRPSSGLPQLGVFVHTDEDPVSISRPVPEYPDMAALTERTGSVWVAALIDVDGSVADARVVKESGSNVGFEEAALAAALKSRYKPAINNGQPIAVWITYRVDFKLDR